MESVTFISSFSSIITHNSTKCTMSIASIHSAAAFGLSAIASTAEPCHPNNWEQRRELADRPELGLESVVAVMHGPPGPFARQDYGGRPSVVESVNKAAAMPSPLTGSKLSSRRPLLCLAIFRRDALAPSDSAGGKNPSGRVGGPSLQISEYTNRKVRPSEPDAQVAGFDMLFIMTCRFAEWRDAWLLTWCVLALT